MLIVDQVKKADLHLRWVAIAVLGGMLTLLGGLWYVQILSSKQYLDSQNVQSFRIVRAPATRGRIMDRNGVVLAENQPRFTVNLYLEDLRSLFRHEYTNTVKPTYLARQGKKSITQKESAELEDLARYRTASNLVWQISSNLSGQPLVLDPKKFASHYNEKRWLPLPILPRLTNTQVATFMERRANYPAVDLEVQAMRTYPAGGDFTHLLGYLRKQDQQEDDDMGFIYSLPEYGGVTGLEKSYDGELRGTSGLKAVLVNHMGYRQREEIRVRPEAGENLVLTVDQRIQRTAVRALSGSGRDTRGAIVVMDVTNGDILAMASSPTFDPNMFLSPIASDDLEYARVNDPFLHPQINRATTGAYAPGSIFKIIVGLAALEAGTLDPEEQIYNPGYYRVTGNKPIADLAPQGYYNFKDAFKRSSNYYFIFHGVRVGEQKIIEMGNRFRLGRKTGVLPKGQERAGDFPVTGETVKKDGTAWRDGDTWNLCIGQGEVTVTPVQMAVMTAAVANGGKIFKPRIASHLVPQGSSGVEPTEFPPAQIEGELKVNPRNLQLVRDAMLADVEEKGGTGSKAFLPGMGICGKTGTAQVEVPRAPVDHITWFVSFAPFAAPKYAVVVMIESGTSGGGDCAPKARQVYETLQKLDQQKPKTTGMTLAPK